MLRNKFTDFLYLKYNHHHFHTLYSFVQLTKSRKLKLLQELHTVNTFEEVPTSRSLHHGILHSQTLVQDLSPCYQGWKEGRNETAAPLSEVVQPVSAMYKEIQP